MNPPTVISIAATITTAQLSRRPDGTYAVRLTVAVADETVLPLSITLGNARELVVAVGKVIAEADGGTAPHG